MFSFDASNSKMQFARFVVISTSYFICYLEACVIPIQEDEKIKASSYDRAGGYKLFK